MSNIQYSIFNEKELESLAREILSLNPQIIALEGPLGAGKTTFTKALAKQLNISDIIVSPTFVLHREYPGLDHIDLWRLNDFKELEQLGLQNMLSKKSLVVLEWADKFRFQIENFKFQIRIVWIKFEYGEKENERRISYENLSH